VLFKIGETVGDYEVLGVLGQGGMAAVYRVRNILSHREEAMKVVLPNATGDPKGAERFLREIRVQAGLRHPNIVELRTAVRAGERILMILELVEGESVSAKLKRGPLKFDSSFSIIDDVLSALSYAHKNGVIHRDIKPANIMVTSTGITKLTDFGIARALGEDRLTQTNIAIGSFHYMSPEQIKANTSDERSDLYSLGVTFYEMVTGRLPVSGQTPFEVLTAHLEATPLRPIDLVPDLPRDVSSVIMKSLAKSPDKRFASAEAFQTALRGALFGEHATDLSTTSGLRTAQPVAPPKPPDPAIQATDLLRVEKRLSTAIGPSAKTLVAEATQRHATLNPLCKELSGHIADVGLRAAFLRSFGLEVGDRAGGSKKGEGASGPATPRGAGVLEGVRTAWRNLVSRLRGARS